MTLLRRGSTTSTPSDPEIRWGFSHAELTEAADELFAAERILMAAGIFGQGHNRAAERACYPAVLSNFEPGSREEMAETEAVGHLRRSAEAMERLGAVCARCRQRWAGRPLIEYVMGAVIHCEMPHEGETVH